MPVEIQTATVFKGGKRRYFTKSAACHGLAREVCKEAFRKQGLIRSGETDELGFPMHEWSDDTENQFNRCVAFMTRVYLIAMKQLQLLGGQDAG